MSKSAVGTIDASGIHVKSKARLNKSILDQAWGEFKRQLKYKLTWRGGMLIEVNPRYTSQKCSDCGYTNIRNRKSQHNFCCMVCQYQ